MSSHFFDKGNYTLGIRLARAVLQVKPDNSYFIVKLAQLYRKAEQPEQSVQVFHSAPATVKRHRGYYIEWGAAEGNAGRYALNIWLAAFALADEAVRRPPDNDHAKLSLNGLSVAFVELYGEFNVPVFIAACGAAANLGLRWS